MITVNCSRYYYWYPISYSSAPLYCYMFRQCAIKVRTVLLRNKILKMINIFSGR